MSLSEMVLFSFSLEMAGYHQGGEVPQFRQTHKLRTVQGILPQGAHDMGEREDCNVQGTE